MDLTPGAVIAGRYRVDHKVGAGGMGEVWAGEHRLVGSRVAIKTLLAAAALNHEVVARFKREAYILGKIRSDHVARVVDFVADDVYGLVLVMELVEGEALNRVLQEKMLTVEETIELGCDIASALCDLHHAHIVHRDLKPGNIILQPQQGERNRAVVVDFGVSRMLSGTEDDEDDEVTGITRADMAVGTIEYMAPEQILNSRAVTSVSDIYATGAILFRAVAGRHTFGNIASDAELAQKKLMTEAPALTLERKDKLAEGLIRVVTRALRRKPVDRFQSAEELLKELLPLRDLARVVSAQLDIDTTIDTSSTVPRSVSSTPTAIEGTPISAQALAAAQGEGRASLPTSAPAVAAAPAARGGVPVAVMLAAVVAALAGGAVLGSGVLKPRVAPATTAESTPTIAAVATATTTATASAVALPSSAPSAAVAPSASAPAPAVSVIDLAEKDGPGPIPDAPPKKLWGAIPKGSASAEVAPAPTAAITAKPAATTAPIDKPTATPTAAPKAPAAPTPIGGPPQF
jgi:serine/threonine-protein kinase